MAGDSGHGGRDRAAPQDMAGSKDRVADIVKIPAETLVLVLVCT